MHGPVENSVTIGPRVSLGHIKSLVGRNEAYFRNDKVAHEDFENTVMRHLVGIKDKQERIRGVPKGIIEISRLAVLMRGAKQVFYPQFSA